MSSAKIAASDPFVLDALAACRGPVIMDTLLDLSDPRGERHLTAESLAVLLATAVANGHCASQFDGRHRFYSITEKGRAWLIGNEVRQVVSECARHTPIRATCCNPPEPEPPMTALICLSEDELDDWWESLEVEQKADAFANFALHAHSGESYVAVEPSPSIPATGTVGEHDDKLFRKDHAAQTATFGNAEQADMNELRP